MNRTLIVMLAVCAGAGCATAPGPAMSAPASVVPAAAPVLRLIDITPRDGSPMDSASVLVAKLAYHIPDFDPDRMYVVSAVFVGAEGGTFNRGGGHAQIRSPAGIVTVRHSMERLWSGDLNRPTRPLTGTFFLLEHDPAPSVEDTLHVGDRTRIRTMTNRSTVRARSRTFFFNGSGPVRSYSAGLPDLLEEYWTYRPHKAIAVAYADSGRWTYGYGYGFQTPEGAAERALAECRSAAERRGIEAPCRLLAVDDEEREPYQGSGPPLR